MKKEKNYVDTFVEEQNNQYTQWKYPLSGQPTPFTQAKGNSGLLSVVYYISSSVSFILGLVISYFNCTNIISHIDYVSDMKIRTVTHKFTFNFWNFVPILLLFTGASIFQFILAKRYSAMAQARKKTALNSQKNRKRKKKNRK